LPEIKSESRSLRKFNDPFEAFEGFSQTRHPMAPEDSPTVACPGGDAATVDPPRGPRLDLDCWFLSGPTAAGKTALALHLAGRGAEAGPGPAQAVKVPVIALDRGGVAVEGDHAARGADGIREQSRVAAAAERAAAEGAQTAAKGAKAKKATADATEKAAADAALAAKLAAGAPEAAPEAAAPKKAAKPRAPKAAKPDTDTSTDA